MVGRTTIRGCGDGFDADACLELVDKTITVTGYQQRLRELLLGDGVDPGLIQQAVSNADDISPAQESLLAVLPGSVGGLVFRTAQFSYPAGYTFGEQAAPVLAVEQAAEVCRKLLFATSFTAGLMHHPYAKEVLTLVRDALHSRAARERGLYRPHTIDALLAAPNDTRTTLGANALWQVALLELWLQSMDEQTGTRTAQPARVQKE